MRTFPLVIVAFLLAAASAGAQNWTPVGPPGGDVRALAADPRDPDRVFLGTADGTLYRSDDGGLNWSRLSPGFPIPGCSLDEISVDSRGQVLIGYWEVRGSGGGVALSSDGGKTFSILRGMAGESVRALAIAASNPQVIAAGSLSGVFLTRDGGLHWKRITRKDDPGLRNIESMAFDPADARILYVGTWHLGWKTIDGGASWKPVQKGMIDDSHVMTLTVHPLNADVVYATACTGIYRSEDGGGRWTKLRGIPDSSRRTRAFAVSEDDPDLLVAGTTEGLWISESGGKSWRLATSEDLVVNAVLLRPNGTIVLGTEGAGVLQSKDRGQKWQATNTGFSERFVSRLLFDTSRDRVLAAVWGSRNYGGVFASSDPGGKWIRLGRGLEGRQVLSLALFGAMILAGTDDGVYARGANESAWKRLPIKIEDEGEELHPRVTDLSLIRPSRNILAVTSQGLLSSLDGGKSWAKLPLGMSDGVVSVATCPQEADLVLAATRSGFFRSRDGGITWGQVGAGLKDVTPHALAFSPTNRRTVFAASSGGLYRSTDQGATWRLVKGGMPRSDITGIAIHPNGRTIYASDFTWGGVFRSVDGGKSWQRMATDGLASDRVWMLALDPASPDRVLAASPAGLHLFSPKTGGSGSAALP